jgi:PAS domain S-box-containing protein
MDQYANAGDTVWRRAMDGAADAMWIADASGIRYVNDAGCQLLGLDRSAILGQSPDSLLTTSGDNAGRSSSPAASMDNPARSFGHVLRPSGALIAVELQRAAIEPGCLHVTAREMTPWVEAHQSIRTSEEQLRKLFDSANDTIYTHALDGNLTYINRTGERMTGYSRRELLAMSASDLIAPEHRELAERMVENQLAGKPAETHELILLAKDGRRVPIEISNWVLHENGQPSGIQGIARDMTERLATNAALLQTQHEAESLATAARELTLSLDRGAVLASIAKQAREVMHSGVAWLCVRRPDGSFRVEVEAGLHQGHFLGLNMQVTEGLMGKAMASGGARVNHHPTTDPDYPPGLRAVMRSEGVTGLVIAPIFLNDEIQALLITARRDAVSYTEAEAELLTRLADLAAPALRNAFLYTAVDEANRDLEEALDHSQRMAEAAQEAARLKSEFLATMSHEIRTPLSGIIGMLEMLAATELGATESEYVHVAHSSSGALLDLVNDILDFSKIEAGSMTLETIEFDPRDTVESAAQVLAARAQAKGLLISTFVDPALGAAIQGDPVRLRQVLLNLVGNAVKFTDSGKVEVRATIDAGGTLVKYTVRDTGIGLPEVARALLFQPFTQADGSTTRKYGGTGLGLAISKSLVELMGGEIGVESTEGEGATFWFTTPLRMGIADARGWTLPAETRVLIIEDRDPLLEVLERYLGSWGAETVTHADASTGLDELRAAAHEGHPYGVVLADAAIAWNGLSLISAARSDPLTSATALVLMGNDVPREASGAKDHGIITYLPLPITRSALFESIQATSSAALWPQTSESLPDESPAVRNTDAAVRNTDAAVRNTDAAVRNTDAPPRSPHHPMA